MSEIQLEAGGHRPREATSEIRDRFRRTTDDGRETASDCSSQWQRSPPPTAIWKALSIISTEAEQLYQPGFMPQLRPIPAMRARMSIAQGALAEAAAWATASGVC
jgi:hypothetical protein